MTPPEHDESQRRGVHAYSESLAPIVARGCTLSKGIEGENHQN